MIPVILLAEPLIFSKVCYMIEGDTLSPTMTYDLQADKINGLNDSSLLMFSDPAGYFEKQYAKYSKEFLSQRDLFEKFPDAASLRHQYYYEIADIPFSSRRFYSLRFHQSCFTGGAHPNSWADHWILRKKDGKLLAFSDIFKADSDAKLKMLIDKALKKKFKREDMDRILFSWDFKVSNDIYLLKKGIVFQYDTYEIAPYYVGPIEVFLPYWKIHKLLRDF
jgi:hypothetical protein